MAGRLSGPQDDPTAPQAPTLAGAEAPVAAADRILLAAAGDHLERSQRLLLDLVNTREEPEPRSAARARELVGGNRLLRQSAGLQGEAALADFLDDLERLLLDLAHAPSADDEAGAEEAAETYEDLRRRVQEEGLLLKLRLLDDALERRSRAAEPRDPAASTPTPSTTRV